MKLNQSAWSIIAVLATTALASLGALFFAPFREGSAGVRDRAILAAYIVFALATSIILARRSGSR